MPTTFEPPPTFSAEAQVESLLAWWTAAGVDVVVEEGSRNWLTPIRQSNPKTPTATQPVIVSEAPQSEAVPASLAEFENWLAHDIGVLAAHPVRRRLPPVGRSGGLMIVTDMPERDDVIAGRLLDGEAGHQFDLMLKAMQLTRDEVYLTALSPSRPPTGLVDDASSIALADILRHHIELVAPTELWLMGDTVSRALLGVNAAVAAGRLHSVNLKSSTVEAMVTLHPRDLRAMPNRKAAAWKDMQMLMGRMNR